MARKFYTRKEIQEILESNELGCRVTYMAREYGGTPDNWITYSRTPARSLRADDVIHIRKVSVSVVHLHKRKLHSIEELMLKHFRTEPSGYNIKQPDTDYWATYYDFDILTDTESWTQEDDDAG